MRTSVAVLSLDNVDIQGDSRVQRQIRALSAVYDVDVITYAHPGKEINLPARSIQVVGSLGVNRFARRLRTLALLPLGKVLPGQAYPAWYWARPGHREALDWLLRHPTGIIHANDWWTFPVAFDAARQTGAKVICDLHEYALDEFPEWWWQTFYRPVAAYFLHKYLPGAAASITVNQTIADRYRAEFGVKPEVVMNAPVLNPEVTFRPTGPTCIRLIHHGAALRPRRLEGMIEALASTDPRFRLTFMLFGDSAYIDDLRRLSSRIAPGRVDFRPPVEPASIHHVLSQYDIELISFQPGGFNLMATLPNKFFESVGSGLAVVTGPFPEMVHLIQQYGFGAASVSHGPAALAEVLNNLTAEKIDRMKHCALQARTELCAENEMNKLLAVYRSVTGEAG